MGTHLGRQSCRLCTPPLLGCLGTASLIEKCFRDRERLEFAGVTGMRSLCCQNVVSFACSTSACSLPAKGRPLQDSTGQKAAASMRISPWPTGSASAKSLRGCKDSKLPMHTRKTRTPGESLQKVLKHVKASTGAAIDHCYLFLTNCMCAQQRQFAQHGKFCQSPVEKRPKCLESSHDLSLADVRGHKDERHITACCLIDHMPSRQSAEATVVVQSGDVARIKPFRHRDRPLCMCQATYQSFGAFMQGSRYVYQCDFFSDEDYWFITKVKMSSVLLL